MQKFQEDGILSHLGAQTPLVLAIILPYVERKELYKFQLNLRQSSSAFFNEIFQTL